MKKRMIGTLLIGILLLFIITTAFADTAAKPNATVIWKVTSSKPGQVLIKWKPVSGITGYQIKYSTDPGMANAKDLFLKEPNRNNTTIKNLEGGRTWYFRVRSFVEYAGYRVNSNWCGAKSVFVSQKVDPTVIYSMTAPACNTVQIKWRSVSNVDGYQIRYASDSSFVNAKTASITKRSKSGSVCTSYTRKDLAPKTTYYAQVRAFKLNGSERIYSNWCGTKTAVTPDIPVESPVINDGRWAGAQYIRGNGQMIKGGVYNIRGEYWFFNEAGINIRTPNTIQLIVTNPEKYHKFIVVYYIKPDGHAAANEWCNVFTSTAQDANWTRKFQSLRKAFFNSEGKLDTSRAPAEFNWQTAEINRDAAYCDGIHILQQGIWRISPKSGKTGYYQWIQKYNLTKDPTNVEGIRQVITVSAPIQDSFGDYGEGYDPKNVWCIRYMDCTLERLIV